MDNTVGKRVEDVAEKAGGMLRSRYGIWTLGIISFVESSLPVPIVTDPFLVAYILADRSRVWLGIVVAILTSILGGVFAYAVAFLFYEFIAVNYLSGQTGEQFHLIVGELTRGTFIFTIIGAITPIPYTLIALAVGFMKGNIVTFIIATLVGRGFRYGVAGWLTYVYGEQALQIAKRHLKLVTIICFVVGALYFFVVH